MPARTKTRAAAAPKAEAAGPAVDETPPIPRDGTIQAKVAWVQQHVQNVEKTGQVSFGKTNFKHMQEHGLIEVLRPLWREVGICVTENIHSYERAGNHLQVAGTLIVTDVNPRAERPIEEWRIEAGYVNEGVDQGDKASNKALTGFMKYALQKFFKVPTEQIDDNDESVEKTRDSSVVPGNAAPQKVDPKTATALRDTIAQAVKEGHFTNARVTALLQGTYGVQKVADLSPDDAHAVAQWVAQEVKSG